LVMYGMTPDEVADLYGVPVDVVVNSHPNAALTHF